VVESPEWIDTSVTIPTTRPLAAPLEMMQGRLQIFVATYCVAITNQRRNCPAQEPRRYLCLHSRL
jgi:hypothetical protein